MESFFLLVREAKTKQIIYWLSHIAGGFAALPNAVEWLKVEERNAKLFSLNKDVSIN